MVESNKKKHMIELSEMEKKLYQSVEDYEWLWQRDEDPWIYPY